jgi:hypothetical protein
MGPRTTTPPTDPRSGPTTTTPSAADPRSGLPATMPADPRPGLPATIPAVDPRTGLPIDPATGLLVGPNVGLLLDGRTGATVDAATGATLTTPAVDPRTGLVVDTRTGFIVQPGTGMLIDRDHATDTTDDAEPTARHAVDDGPAHGAADQPAAGRSPHGIAFVVLRCSRWHRRHDVDTDTPAGAAADSQHRTTALGTAGRAADHAVDGRSPHGVAALRLSPRRPSR